MERGVRNSQFTPRSLLPAPCLLHLDPPRNSPYNLR
jgi:hypothetical protein